MRIVAFALLCAAAAVAQTPKRDLGLPAMKPVEVDFNKTLDAIKTASHIHTIPYSCKGKPDQVYARRGSVYYACLNGKDVCSEEKGVSIPYKLVEKLQEAERVHDTRMAEGRAQMSNAFAASQRMSTRAAVIPAVAVSQVSATDLIPGTARPLLQDDKLEGVSVGTSRADVLEKLGNPQMKISGDVDSYLYYLQSGNSAQLQFESGKLTKIDVIRR